MELKLKVGLLTGGFHGSVLHACADEGKDEIARILLEHGADANIQCKLSLLLQDLGLIRHSPWASRSAWLDSASLCISERSCWSC
jgi:hypothetical protein